MGKEKLAVIGGGVCGLSAAYFLDESSRFQVTLFEKENRLGGNAITVDAKSPDGQPHPVDPVTYLFIPQRYPYFTRWIRQLGVPTSSMPFDNYVWDAHRGRGVLLSQSLRRFVRSPDFGVQSVKAALGFRRAISTAQRLNAEGNLPDRMTMAEFVRAAGLDEAFVWNWFYPLYYSGLHADARSIENTPCGVILRTYAKTAENSTAYCIQGGVSKYIEVVHRQLQNVQLRVGTGVASVSRRADTQKWQVRCEDGSSMEFDRVILAVWPHQAAQLLRDGIESGGEATPHIRDMIGAMADVPIAFWRYTVHNDTRMMSPHRKNWATYTYKHLPMSSSLVCGIWSGQVQNQDVFTSYDWNLNPARVADGQAVTQMNGPVHGVGVRPRAPQTRNLYAARSHVDATQGREQLWITGSYLRESCFHEDGLLATMQLVERLVPDRSELGRFNQLIPGGKAVDRGW